MPSTPSPCTLNSPPHPQVRDLLLFITYGGGSEDLGVSRGFQGGERRDTSSLTECKGG